MLHTETHSYNHKFSNSFFVWSIQCRISTIEITMVKTREWKKNKSIQLSSYQLEFHNLISVEFIRLCTVHGVFGFENASKVLQNVWMTDRILIYTVNEWWCEYDSKLSNCNFICWILIHYALNLIEFLASNWIKEFPFIFRVH